MTGDPLLEYEQIPKEFRWGLAKLEGEGMWKYNSACCYYWGYRGESERKRVNYRWIFLQTWWKIAVKIIFTHTTTLNPSIFQNCSRCTDLKSILVHTCVYNGNNCNANLYIQSAEHNTTTKKLLLHDFIQQMWSEMSHLLNLGLVF